MAKARKKKWLVYQTRTVQEVTEVMATTEDEAIATLLDSVEDEEWEYVKEWQDITHAEPKSRK